MTDSTRLRLLWTIALSGIAALLATLSTRFANLWLVQFGCDLLALTALSCLTRRFPRRKAPTQVAMATRAARWNGELPSSFLSVAGHEIKTPLAGIKAYVELLADGDADDPAVRDEFLDGIVSQVARLERAIEELLSKARDNDLSRRAPQDTVMGLVEVVGPGHTTQPIGVNP